MMLMMFIYKHGQNSVLGDFLILALCHRLFSDSSKFGRFGLLYNFILCFANSVTKHCLVFLVRLQKCFVETSVDPPSAGEEIIFFSLSSSCRNY